MAGNLTTVKRVAWGFGVLTLVLVLAVVLTLWQVSRTSATTSQLVNEYAPTAESSLRILNGVNNSLADLRGYVLLGNRQFEVDRAAAWSQRIQPEITHLKTLANVPQSLVEIQQKYAIGELEQHYQQAVEGVKQSETLTTDEKVALVAVKLSELKADQEGVVKLADPELKPTSREEANIESHYILMTVATPKADEIIDYITQMMDAEQRLEATEERKELLYNMGNFRNSFGLCVSNIRGYLMSGEENPFLASYQTQWERNERATENIQSRTQLLMGQQGETWQSLLAARNQFKDLPQQMFDSRASPSWNRANAMLRDVAAPRAAVVQRVLTDLLDEIDPKVLESQSALARNVAFLTAMQWMLLAVGLIVAVGVTWTIIRDVRGSIAQVLTAAQQVSTASTEIAAGSQQQLASLNQTATSLNQITTTAEEFKATMQEFADRSRAVQEAADDTAQQTVEGRALTRESASRIEQVRDNSRTAGESVLNLSEQMQRIGEITATVNEIAEQTKLLALNASIEAARAGEDGRGFAVVATQVRELANQSKAAAARIESLITDTHKSMQQVVTKIEEGSRLSEDSVANVRQMSDAFELIAQSIEQTREAMSQINTGARQQEDGIVELVTSITEIDNGSKESLAAAQQTQKAITSIDEQIKSLTQLMARF